MLEDSTLLELSTVIYTFTLLFTMCCEVWLFSETNREIAKLIYEDGTLRNIIYLLLILLQSKVAPTVTRKRPTPTLPLQVLSNHEELQP